MDKIITKSIEDYLKTIYILTRKKDFAKTSDISS
ncbi:MAG TPA: transcriptional regulator, partial [Methanomicrobia archaeon]|nr:transcriptional regulator [Methanomicrobia archaeon]